MSVTDPPIAKLDLSSDFTLQTGGYLREPSALDHRLAVPADGQLGGRGKESRDGDLLHDEARGETNNNVGHPGGADA